MHIPEGMHETNAISFCRTAPAALLCSLLLASACGDAGEGPVVSDDTVLESLPRGLEGVEVHLVRDSTRCGAPDSTPLVADAGIGIEFTADHVRTLASPCAGSPSPAIEVNVENGGVIFDFANVDQPGEFPGAQFEGYVVHFARSCGDPVVASATPDTDLSNIDVRHAKVTSHYDRLKVNFAGVAYDRSSFLRIDVSWANVDCLADPAE
jgi:hypothetical protein